MVAKKILLENITDNLHLEKHPLKYYLLGGWREERDADKAKAGSIWCWGAIAKFDIGNKQKKHILHSCLSCNSNICQVITLLRHTWRRVGPSTTSSCSQTNISNCRWPSKYNCITLVLPNIPIIPNIPNIRSMLNNTKVFFSGQDSTLGGLISKLFT